MKIYGFLAYVTAAEQHNQRPINNEEAVVIVMPVEHHLSNLNQLKYEMRYRRIAKNAFIGGHKCWVTVIEIGNGEFSDLLPGLVNSNVLYVLFEDKIVKSLKDKQEKITHGIKFDSFTLKNYKQEQGDVCATYECKLKKKKII